MSTFTRHRSAGLAIFLFTGAAILSAQPSRLHPDLQTLAAEFFAWRAVTQPCTGDDIPRVERPDGWTPDFSPETLARSRTVLATFTRRLKHLQAVNWSRSDSVDYLLLRSAVERVRWELDILRIPHRDPNFYVQQSLGSVYELLLLSSPMSDRRIAEIILRLRAIPNTVRDAKVNLTAPVQAFARPALSDLEGVRERLQSLGAALKEIAAPSRHQEIDEAVTKAASALTDYDTWIRARMPRMEKKFNPGRTAYVHYLRTVALNPLSPEQMLVMGRTEYDRAVACETVEANRNRNLPQPQLFQTIGQQIEQCRNDELAIRTFLRKTDLLTVPDWIGHYGNRPTPAYVQPLSGLGVPDDLTSESRKGDDAFSYIPPPGPGLSYFREASARDPRPIIIHEGIPGHFFQMAVSWSHDDPIRRRYIDSGSNEGWGFYVEELLLQAGLFDDDRPRTRETIYNFMRLRALRVEVDIQLALGEFSLQQAGDYLARLVPMDRATAEDEACFFAATPGQAITYQIGKLQIQRFLRDARAVLGDRFSLRNFHDYIVKNGNVPIALQRWEYLGLRDEVDKLWP
jgi:uncharacterized protein (DUF885 family)